MIDPRFKTIFKQGSKTYYNSSYFFPEPVRQQVLVLYGFVRTADDLVDAIPSQNEAFQDFRKDWETASRTGKSDNFIIQAFVDLSRKLNFNNAWTKAFLDSMAMDLEHKVYNTLAETEEYIYGSAEVIGLFMAKIMNLPEESWKGAMKLGKAMQFINFIRDIAEDNVLGRAYFPKEDLDNCGLESLDSSYIFQHQANFEKFVHLQLCRYNAWQLEAEENFKYIPKRYLIPIKTASEMYKWTAKKIAKNPAQVFTKKIKPRRYRIFLTALREIIVW